MSLHQLSNFFFRGSREHWNIAVQVLHPCTLLIIEKMTFDPVLNERFTTLAVQGFYAAAGYIKSK